MALGRAYSPAHAVTTPPQAVHPVDSLGSGVVMEGSHESCTSAMALLMGGAGVAGSSTNAMGSSMLQMPYLPAGSPATTSQPMLIPGQMPGGNAAALGLQMQQLASSAHMSAQEQRVRGVFILLRLPSQPISKPP